MFTKPELNFLLMCVEEKRVENTQVARNKAVMALKLCDLIDAPDPEPETPPNEPAPKKAPAKKAPRKK